MNKIFSKISAVLIALLFLQCSQSWQKALSKGGIQHSSFNQTIDVEIIKGIIIIPVTINGKNYRFLFDTGAPTSISNDIQEEFSFKKVSTGKIVDSDNHRKKVIYVGIESIFLGEVPFLDQTAFVGDFKANPILACMEVDGIIGSNLIHFCNWTIDYQNKTISFTNQDLLTDDMNLLSQAFTTDDQFNIITKLKIGDATISKLKIDYGSNNSLSMPSEVFLTLVEKNIIKESFVKKGATQSGITGKVKAETSKVAYLDTVKIGNKSFIHVAINSNGNGLIGSGILSRSVVSIDWSNKQLYFSTTTKKADLGDYGFNIGEKNDGSLYIQSIIDGSSAAEVGIVSNMKILRIDSMDFTSSSTFCDYIDYTKSTDSLYIKVVSSDGDISEHTLIKRDLR